MASKRTSLTASLVAAVRALHNELEGPLKLTDDPHAAQLLPIPMAGPFYALSFAPKAARFMHSALGTALLGLPYHIELRTRAIDDALMGALRDGAEELVILGAGLDSRPYRIGALRDVDVFEIDRLPTQEYKQLRIELTAERSSKSLTYLSVDFEKDDLAEVLRRGGLLRAAKKMWIWEGVTVYLTPSAIARTLGEIGALSPIGSRLAVTYGPAELDGIGRALLPFAERALEAIGEPLRGRTSTAEFQKLVEDAGFRVVSDESALDWADRYWAERPSGLRAWERLVVAERV
jgi:methyltransferase (TIGR00027 family)